MSAAASLLLLTLAVASPQQPSAPNAERRGGSSTDAPHRLGLGGSMGISNRGGGAAFRYFMNDRIGLNMQVGWYRPPVTNSSLGSTLIAAPSFIWMLKRPDPLADVDLRPYAGGGLNYSRGGYNLQPRTSVGSETANRGLGGQAFGGVEMTFKEAKAIAISAEVIHYQVATSGVGSTVRDGTTFSLLFHFYVN